MAPAVLGALFSVGVAFADSDELIRRAKDDWVEQQQVTLPPIQECFEALKHGAKLFAVSQNRIWLLFQRSHC
ncbi:unnamed protein product [Brassica rapa]|uniref:Uncharacterized protein n=2 Tax=Brassica TaxID=3705 RepID=A0A3P5YKR4_BRACM|nr:unnamed protein product [Brassica napus]CAG7862403.1 unnamed protein product [Brassica rapa]VDC60608.1 unnamed protein product [Brassica rapa]